MEPGEDTNEGGVVASLVYGVEYAVGVEAEVEEAEAGAEGYGADYVEGVALEPVLEVDYLGGGG